MRRCNRLIVMWRWVRRLPTLWWLILTLSGLINIIIIIIIVIGINISDVHSIIGLQSLNCDGGFHSIDLVTFVIGNRLINFEMTCRLFDSRRTSTRITDSRNTTTPSTMTSVRWWIGVITFQSSFFAHWIKLVFTNDHAPGRTGFPGTIFTICFPPLLEMNKK